MATSTFFVSGDQGAARTTVDNLLAQMGFTLKYHDLYSGVAERGSKGATIALGALSGKSQHMRVQLSFATDPHGNTAVTLRSDTTGAAAGLIGVSRAKAAYAELFGTVRATFINAGVLLGEQAS